MPLVVTSSHSTSTSGRQGAMGAGSTGGLGTEGSSGATGLGSSGAVGGGSLGAVGDGRTGATGVGKHGTLMGGVFLQGAGVGGGSMTRVDLWYGRALARTVNPITHIANTYTEEMSMRTMIQSQL